MECRVIPMFCDALEGVWGRFRCECLTMGFLDPIHMKPKKNSFIKACSLYRWTYSDQSVAWRFQVSVVYALRIYNNSGSLNCHRVHKATHLLWIYSEGHLWRSWLGHLLPFLNFIGFIQTKYQLGCLDTTRWVQSWFLFCQDVQSNYECYLFLVGRK